VRSIGSTTGVGNDDDDDGNEKRNIKINHVPNVIHFFMMIIIIGKKEEVEDLHRVISSNGVGCVKLRLFMTHGYHFMEGLPPSRTSKAFLGVTKSNVRIYI